MWQCGKEDLQVYHNPPNCWLCGGGLTKIEEPYHYMYYEMTKPARWRFWKEDQFQGQVCQTCKDRLVSEGWVAVLKDGYWGGSCI